MPDPIAPPALSLDVAPDGGLHFNGSVPASVVKSAAAVNWLQIIQTLIALAPQVMALVQAIVNGFNPQPTPPTPPAPKQGATHAP